MRTRSTLLSLTATASLALLPAALLQAPAALAQAPADTGSAVTGSTGAGLAGLGSVDTGSAALGSLEGTATAGPTGITAPPAGPEGELFVPEVNEDRIAVIDTATNAVKQYIPMKDGAKRPGVMAKTPDGTKLYSDNFGQVPPTVTVIDREKGTDTTIPVFSTPVGIFASADGTEMYLPEEGFTVQVIDVATDTIVRTFRYPDIPVASIPGPDGNLYLGFNTGFVAPVDPKTGAFVRPPLHMGGISPFWYTFSKDGSKLYVDVINKISVVDVASWRVVKTIDTAPDGRYDLTNPGAFTSTLSPDGSKLYVTLFGRPGVLVIDTATDTIIRELPVAGDTPSVIFSEDGTRGYISDLTTTRPTPVGEIFHFAELVLFSTVGPARLDVFDPRTDEMLGQIPVGRGVGVPEWVPPLKS